MEISHDFHIHTNLSICAKRDATTEGYIAAAKQLGLKKIGFANHLWDEKISSTCNDMGIKFYEKQNCQHLLKQKEELKNLDTNGLEVLFGCEVDYCSATTGPAITEESAVLFDYIIVPNSHTHLIMPKEYYEPKAKHAAFMVEAYRNIVSGKMAKYVTAVAHPFEAVCCPYPRTELFKLIPQDTFKELFDLTARADIAVEINQETFGEALKSDEEWFYRAAMIETAKSCGCKFIFGSDAHSHSHLLNLQNSKELFSKLGLCETDISDFAL